MVTTNEEVIKKYRASKHRLKRVPTRYFDVFEYCHGIADGRPHTKEETGKRFGVSGTRIGQLIARVRYDLEQLDAPVGRKGERE